MAAFGVRTIRISLKWCEDKIHYFAISTTFADYEIPTDLYHIDTRHQYGCLCTTRSLAAAC